MNCRIGDVGEKGGREYPDLIDPITNDDSNSGADKDSKVLIQKYSIFNKDILLTLKTVHTVLQQFTFIIITRCSNSTLLFHLVKLSNQELIKRLEDFSLLSFQMHT